MQALVLDSGLNLNYRPDYPRPEPVDDEALIRMKLAGICATDLELLNGYAGFSGVLGHEFVGVVEKVKQEAQNHWIGRRVVGSINIGCQHCTTCHVDGAEHCLQRSVLGIRGKDGAFSDYLTLPVANLHAVPDEVTDEAAVFTEPLAAALRVVEQLRPFSMQSLAVLGPGRLGLLIAKVLALAGYTVTVLGRSEASLRLPQEWSLTAALVGTIADNQFDCVVDATGQASGFAQALRILKPQGVLVLKSTFAANQAVDLSKIVVAEIQVIGSRCGPFAQALDVLLSGKIPVEMMIDGRFSLQDSLSAFRYAAQSGVRKILLHP